MNGKSSTQTATDDMYVGVPEATAAERAAEGVDDGHRRDYGSSIMLRALCKSLSARERKVS